MLGPTVFSFEFPLFYSVHKGCLLPLLSLSMRNCTSHFKKLSIPVMCEFFPTRQWYQKEDLFQIDLPSSLHWVSLFLLSWTFHSFFRIHVLNEINYSVVGTPSRSDVLSTSLTSLNTRFAGLLKSWRSEITFLFFPRRKNSRPIVFHEL